MIEQIDKAVIWIKDGVLTRKIYTVDNKKQISGISLIFSCVSYFVLLGDPFIRIQFLPTIIFILLGISFQRAGLKSQICSDKICNILETPRL